MQVVEIGYVDTCGRGEERKEDGENSEFVRSARDILLDFFKVLW